MAKHRNKKREKIKKLQDKLAYTQTLSYYHKPEDIEDIKRKIKFLEATL